MFSTSSPPTEQDFSRLLNAEQYSDLFCSVSTLPEDSESHIRVADKLSSTEERDRLLAERNQRPSVKGNSIAAVSRSVFQCHAVLTKCVRMTRLPCLAGHTSSSLELYAINDMQVSSVLQDKGTSATRAQVQVKVRIHQARTADS